MLVLQGEIEGQLALLASADDLKARLSDQLVRGLTECMVCLERVKQNHATWDCHNCYQVRSGIAVHRFQVEVVGLGSFNIILKGLKSGIQ